LVEQIRLLEQMACVLDELGQQLEQLRRKWYGLGPAQKLTLLLIEPVPVEDEQALGRHPTKVPKMIRTRSGLLVCLRRSCGTSIVPVVATARSGRDGGEGL